MLCLAPYGCHFPLIIASRVARFALATSSAQKFSSHASSIPSTISLPPLSILRIQSTSTKTITIETIMNADSAVITSRGASAWRLMQYEQPCDPLSINSKPGASMRSVLELQESPMSIGEGELHLLIPDRWISIDILAQAPNSKVKVNKVTEADFNVKCTLGGQVEIGSIRANNASIDTGKEGGLRGGELSGTDVNVTAGSLGIQLRRFVALRGTMVGSGRSSVTSIGSCFGEHLNITVEGPIRISNMSCSGASPSSLLSSAAGPIVVEGLEGNAKVQVDSDSHVSLHVQGKCGDISLVCGSGQGSAEIAVGPEALPIRFLVDSACKIVNQGGEEWGEGAIHPGTGRTTSSALFKGADKTDSEGGEGRGRGPGGGGDANPYSLEGGQGRIEVGWLRQLTIKRMSWMEALKMKMSLRAQESGQA